jgi:PPOX class probable F420-dependent enzyme
MANGVLPDSSTPFGRRVADRLRDDQVIWFTTVGADGTPHPNPVWFLWTDDGHLLVYNRPDAHRLTHIRHRPRVALHFDEDGTGDRAVVLAGEADLPTGLPRPHEMPAYLAKYRDGMRRVSGSSEAFGAAYRVPIHVCITRIRGF